MTEDEIARGIEEHQLLKYTFMDDKIAVKCAAAPHPHPRAGGALLHEGRPNKLGQQEQAPAPNTNPLRACAWPGICVP